MSTGKVQTNDVTTVANFGASARALTEIGEMAQIVFGRPPALIPFYVL